VGPRAVLIMMMMMMMMMMIIIISHSVGLWARMKSMPISQRGGSLLVMCSGILICVAFRSKKQVYVIWIENVLEPYSHTITNTHIRRWVSFGVA
jgi:hypothetical protein